MQSDTYKRNLNEAMQRFQEADPAMAKLISILEVPDDQYAAILQTAGYLEKHERPASWHRRLVWLWHAWRATRMRG